MNFFLGSKLSVDIIIVQEEMVESEEWINGNRQGLGMLGGEGLVGVCGLVEGGMVRRDKLHWSEGRLVELMSRLVEWDE